MKEKIIEILKENYFEEIPDLLVNLFNQEVERRIAERMPSKDDINIFLQKHPGNSGSFMIDAGVSAGFIEGVKWLRSRLTKDMVK